MRIIAHGVDLVEVGRVDGMLAEHPERFPARVFTPGEVAHSAGKARRAEHLAARFAAKEAVMKALGTGLDHGVSWTEIEVVSLATGQPTLRLSGRAAEVAAGLGITGWMISLTHTAENALASVIAVGE